MNQSKPQTSYHPHSAISSWNGFIYQGKVALYVVIRMMVDEQNCDDFKLRLEHLEDFAIFDPDDKAISLHQVKATVSRNRSSYEDALLKASNIYPCNTEAKRYFHVSTLLDDFQSYGEGSSLVTFYENHESNSFFIGLDEIENYIKEMVSRYLDKFGFDNTEELILFKYNKLLSFIDSKVNYIHAVNQSTAATQLQATDQNPISFQEIKTIIESTYPEDEVYFLEKFRRSFIGTLNNFAEYRDQSNLCVHDLVKCKKAISILDQDNLQQLYFSFDPTKNRVETNCSNNDLSTYMDIICTLDRLITNTELPHYKSFEAKSFLPTGFGLNNVTSAWTLTNVQKNIESAKAHSELINLFYEYNNFIVNMDGNSKSESLSIDLKATHNGGIDDPEFNQVISKNLEKGNFMRKKAIRFVSSDIAKKELMKAK